MKLSVLFPFTWVTSITQPIVFVLHVTIFLLLLLIPSSSSAQVKRKLPPKVYERVIRPNTPVEVKIIEDGKVKETNTTPLKDLQLFVGSKAVAPTNKNIEVMDTASFRKAKLDPKFKGVREDFKIIPELHIETRESGTASYNIAFTLLEPFRYDFIQKTFNATLGFLLVPVSESNTTTVLEPVHIEVVSNVAKTITPDHLTIPHLSLPSSKIALMAEHVSDSAEVKVITAYNTSGYSTYLKVEPALELYTNQTTLQGYGIQKIPVIVRFIGSNSSDSVEVSFSVSNGTVEPTSMQVSYNTPATIYLRSEGTGVAELSAVTNFQQSNKISFTYIFPWSFLLFSIAGGLIGGLAKHYFTSDKKNFPVKPIIGGILIGFIVAVAYYFLGINLIGLSLSATVNEMAVLGISALGAYFGINVAPKPTT